MKAYTKDIIKTITKGKKRFFALMLIAALGVCMFSGLKASCDDLRYSADKFFDEQNLFDIQIVSTMGLTEDDIEILSQIEGIEAVEGGYSEKVFTEVEGKTKQATVNILSQQDINVPYLLEGEMPMRSDEILVTQKYILDTGAEIGDTVIIEENMEDDQDEEDAVKDTETSEDEEAEDDVSSEFELELEKEYDKEEAEESTEEEELEVEIMKSKGNTVSYTV